LRRRVGAFRYLRAKDAEKMIAFCKRAFGATKKFRLVEPSGCIGHAELMLGNAVPMLSDEFPEYDIYASEADARSTFVIHLHVDDADATIEQAVSAGARLVRPPQDQFCGERSGTVRDPFGYDWMIGQSIEEVDPDEMQRRYTRMLAPAGAAGG
jgi:PhnB protein